MSKSRTFLTVVADSDGEVFEHPDLLMAGMNGLSLCRPQAEELIPLPEGSRLFTIPNTPPIGFDRRSGQQKTVGRMPKSWGGGCLQAVSAFVTPGFTRTLLPAADYLNKPVELTLWSYTAVGWCVEEERFYVAAVRVDRNRQWEPEHFDDRKLEPLVRRRLANEADNRLLEQLSRCALDYHCFAAKNLFFGRWEAPLPCSPACNAQCLGCISLQDEPKACQASQDRIDFVPTVDEICALAVPHLEKAENAIVSFGQGCEGDPIMQIDIVCAAVRQMRRQTDRGTINFNTNASIPGAIDQLAAAGVDSIRVSLNSVQERFYNAYYRPRCYRFADVLESIRRAKQHGLFTMLNYLVFPGITDREDEIETLLKRVEDTGIDLIQMRNLSIDPLLYWSTLGAEGKGIGMKKMLDLLKQQVPRLQFGYFNRTRENFYPRGFENDWPLPAQL
ncbi:radical SAM protein [Pelovirga terrestris]|uniref:Radical SAM protein n=1 Tax=Pelovirga terrestris TaxID=2771352 RepID=A0A8J6QM17_9BACT|nr:radical SAM protein [Pelovirga terrestris]MBD1399473.1 radical SAM protein [Pelovirga terrestris]